MVSPPQNSGGAGLHACAQARHFAKGLQPMIYRSKHPAQKTRKARFAARPHRVFLFFFTLYIQNSILQGVIVSCFANLYLPCHQQLAQILTKMPS
jgi:hypothetical protein